MDKKDILKMLPENSGLFIIMIIFSNVVLLLSDNI